jgi:5'-deoxynucleotidase YfbR-like HD superfamily hydrolase
MSDFILKNLWKKLQAGHVVRFHTRPEVGQNQTVASHTWRALVILTTLWPDTSGDAVLQLLYHDIAEAELGDLPATTKWNYKGLAEEFKKAEDNYVEELNLLLVKHLTPAEQERVKMSDMLELVLHCMRQMQQGNSLASDVYFRGRSYLLTNFQESSEFGPVKEILETLDTQLAEGGQKDGIYSFSAFT